MTLRDLQTLVNDAIERGEDRMATIIDDHPDTWRVCALGDNLAFGFARFTNGYWTECNEGDPGAEPVAWFE